jgi:hypothetical protein
MVLYRFTWKALKPAKVLHALIGLLCWLGATATLVLFLGVKRTASAYPDVFPADPTLVSYFDALLTIPAGSYFWPLLAQAVPLSVGMAAGLGLGYLLLRRRDEDFGRDYYAFALRYTARWALCATLLQAVALVWMINNMVMASPVFNLQSPSIIALLVGLGLFLLACVCWVVVARSATPLRLKPLIVVALLLAVGGLVAESYPMIWLLL